MLSLLTAALLFPAADPTDDWPRFRGPNGSGVAESATPPTEFGPDKNVLWKTPLPPGVSSPCVQGDRIYLTACTPEEKRLETLALDRATGDTLYLRTASRLYAFRTPH